MGHAKVLPQKEERTKKRVTNTETHEFQKASFWFDFGVDPKEGLATWNYMNKHVIV